MVRRFSYEPIGTAEARRWIAQGLGTLNDDDHPVALAKWRSDPDPLAPADVLSMAAGTNDQVRR